jgi:hypothetical protein
LVSIRGKSAMARPGVCVDSSNDILPSIVTA